MVQNIRGAGPAGLLPCLHMVSIDNKFYDYADVLAPYGVAMRYPNELQLEERHAAKAIEMAIEFVAWADSLVEEA